MDPIAFIDLDAQRRRLGPRLEAAILGAVAEGHFILGPQVAEFEQRLARFGGAAHAVACANGTDAIALSLMTLGVKPGDAVLVPSFTFAATAEAVASSSTATRPPTRSIPRGSTPASRPPPPRGSHRGR